jgi:hypothetical protein
MELFSQLPHTFTMLEFQVRDMPFRRLGSSGLRIPLFSLGGCAPYFALADCAYSHLLSGLTIGGTVKGDGVKV